MGELRQDPLTGTWVAIATERARRASDFATGPAPENDAAVDCPFCPGNERMTPPELEAVRPTDTRPDTPGWTVRVVPNKYSAFQAPAEGRVTPPARGFWASMPAQGAQEVVVVTPFHRQALPTATVDHIDHVLAVCQHRMHALMQRPWVAYPLLFQNVGPAAGASRVHAHFQLVGLPQVPATATTRSESGARWHLDPRVCGVCQVLAEEERQGLRVVLADTGFVTHTPYASRVPFEMRLIPRAHKARFTELDPAERRRLAEHWKQVLNALTTAVPGVPYNWVLYTGATEVTHPGDHWHIDVIPRLTHQAGVEWGTGMYINPVPPETAAEELRAALASPG